jgi:hypothetical protein
MEGKQILFQNKAFNIKQNFQIFKYIIHQIYQKHKELKNFYKDISSKKLHQPKSSKN